MDAIITFLVDRWPVLAAIIVAVVVTIFACKWYFGRFVPTEKKAEAAEAKLGKMDEISKAVDTLPCSKHDESFAKIMEAIAEIRTFLMVKNPKTAAMFALKHSPLSLNEEGKKLFDDVSGSEFLSTNKEVLIACIDGKTPKTALDVEESALEVLYEHLDDDMFNGMKKWVYNSPSRKMVIDGTERDYTVTMNDVCFVLSLPLRDMYLELHPELL
jgi:hypothetical protein